MNSTIDLRTSRKDLRLTEQQVREVLLSPLAARALGEKMGISASGIIRVRNGRCYARVAQELPRRGKPFTPKPPARTSSCRRCIHWLNEVCTMGFPEAAESTTFAADCSIYQLANPTDEDYR
jgi:hypothetical protein